MRWPASAASRQSEEILGEVLDGRREGVLITAKVRTQIATVLNDKA